MVGTTNLKCLILTMSMGHESIAKAIQEILLDHNFQVKLFKENFVEVGIQYQPIYQFFPKINKEYYRLGKSKSIQKIMKKFYEEKKRKKLEKIIDEYSPDIIFSTYFLHNFALGEIKKRRNFIFFNVIANPRTTHPLEYTAEADCNLVYDKVTLERAIEYGVPKEKLLEIGWFTKKEFFAVGDTKNTGEIGPKGAKSREVAFQTSHKTTNPTILVSAGSLGTSQIAKFLPIFFKHQDHFHFIFITGKNKALYEIFKQYQNLCDIMKKDCSQNEVIEYTSEMPKYMAKADLIAGKAGPNLLFEAVASKKPFLALTYIPGQEDENLDLIKEKDLGWVALKTKEADRVLRNIYKHPDEVSQKLRKVEIEREKILESEKILINRINELIQEYEP